MIGLKQKAVCSIDAKLICNDPKHDTWIKYSDVEERLKMLRLGVSAILKKHEADDVDDMIREVFE